jgi:glucose/arabinose dehydrogenase
MRSVVGVFLVALIFVLPSTARAEQLVHVAGGYDSPVYATMKRGALYVVEQEGQVWRGVGSARRLFLDIRGQVSCCGERGLFSITFDGSYNTNRLFYVNYTDNGGDIRFARFRATADFAGTIPGTRRVLATVEHSSQSNHNGGQIVWGSDGRLYMSTGDGGGSCDAGDNAQDVGSWLGKIFSMNPRNLSAGRRMEVYGLRNPWRFSFDRANGRFYIADVGQNNFEEVNTQPPGSFGDVRENYGWRVYEGFSFNPCGDTTLGGPSPHRRPIDAYDHSLGCSVTGGFAYRGSALTNRDGWYYFGDYCSGRIWRLLHGTGRLLADRRLVLDTSLNISSFGENRYGELYVVDHGGTVYRLAP